LTKDFTTQNEGALAKTYPVNSKASINQDKSTYISGEQERLIMLLKDRRRRPKGVNGSQSKFLKELGLYPEIDPTTLSSNSAKTA
jgi:hypothetical protein